MKYTNLGLSLAFGALVSLSSCGGGTDAPSQVEASDAEQAPVHSGLTPNPEMKESEHFTGRVTLADELATGDGALFVTVGRKGSPIPYLMKKYELDGPVVEAGADGARLVQFELTSRDNFMGAPLPDADLEFKARFDIDGFVETKVDSVTEALDVEPGARGIEVTLREAPAYNPAEDG